jgi:hypothetical protein
MKHGLARQRGPRGFLIENVATMAMWPYGNEVSEAVIRRHRRESEICLVSLAENAIIISTAAPAERVAPAAG